MRKKNELRRSCNLCRTRKIACSGEHICATCRERGVECVYDLEGFKGRPPANLQADAAKSQASVYPETWYSPVGGSPPASKKSDDGIEKQKHPSSVAAELDYIYREHFGEKPPCKRNNKFQKRVTEFNRSLVASKGHATESSTSTSSISSTDSVLGMNYYGFLTLVTLDLVETVVLKFSRLGVHAFFGTGERYYRVSMLQDETNAMFDTPIAHSDSKATASASTATSRGSSPDLGPLEKYSTHLLAQMVDLWFTHHPLSILLSKSLLLTDLRTNHAKPTLLAIILVDAHEFTKDPEGGKQAAQLLDWALGQLRHLKNDSPDLTTSQACFLLGWYLSCRGQARRAVSYITYAGRTATQLKYKIHDIPITDKTHINGIDRGSVEIEMIQNLWWITYALVLWSFIQMDISFADLLPSRIMQVFPPSDAADCAILKLDRTMGNITTQRAQTSSLKSIWLVAHVSSFVAHIYALYPYSGSGLPSIETSATHWQDQLLMTMDHLMNRQRDLAAICVDVGEAMQDMINSVNADAGEEPVRPWLLAQYYTVSIHMLFPREKPDTAYFSPDFQPTACVLTSTMFNGLEKALQGLISIFSHVKAAVTPEESYTSAPPAFLHSYILGLDAIGRAFTQILHVQDRASPLEQQFSSGWLRRLLPGLITIHKFFDSDTLLRDHRWRPVKRQIKYARKRLDEAMATEYALGSSTTVPSRSSLANVSTSSARGGEAATQSEEILQWPEWKNLHQSGPDSLNIPTFNIAGYRTSMNEPLRGNDHSYNNSDGIQSNPSIDWLQNPTQLTSMWSEIQATDSGLSSQIPTVMASSELGVNENGKRQADMMPFDDNMLMGDLSAGQLNSALFDSRTPDKRYKSA